MRNKSGHVKSGKSTSKSIEGMVIALDIDCHVFANFKN